MVEAEAKADGWYALITVLPADEADATQVLVHCKGQGAVERRYSDFKGPLAVTPLFVQSNRRAAALVQAICLALLVFCLIERQVRRALDGDGKMAGLYPDNRRARPTGRVVFYHLGELTVRIGSATDPAFVVINCGVQLHPLVLLSVDIRRTRWPQT
ncbi:hypothetical protein ACFY0A_38300 [Streptomyces sp. NPDC001698]|uniref:hypothetical protein n=1 Tax=Streptomyces sp. NPDC001698 TaxID=3364601 RepID=UPI00367CBAD7